MTTLRLLRDFPPKSPTLPVRILSKFVLLVVFTTISIHQSLHIHYTTADHEAIGSSPPSSTSSVNDTSGVLVALPPEESHAPPSCALLFFGVPRLFDVVLPSIQKYVLGPNAQCDVFVHTYNITALNTTRNGEVNGRLSPSDVYKLVPNHPNHVAMDTLERFESMRNLSYYRQFHNPGYGPCCDSLDNMIKQWHSIQSAWNLMEEHSVAVYNLTASQIYRRIGLFRQDVFYTHPISIMKNRKDKAVVPDWHWRKIRQSKYVVNDRMFYGSFDYAKTWATGRFAYVEKYALRSREWLKAMPWHPHGVYLHGVHSEAFLYSLLKREHNIKPNERPICFWLTRTTGIVLPYDCNPPPYISDDGTKLFADPEIWDMLNGTQCFWKSEAQPCKEGYNTHIAPSRRESASDFGT